MSSQSSTLTEPDARRRRRCETSHTTFIHDNPLLTAREAAAERRQGVSTFWRDVKRGLIPPPIYVSARCPRWPRKSIRPDLF